MHTYMYNIKFEIKYANNIDTPTVYQNHPKEL